MIAGSPLLAPFEKVNWAKTAITDLEDQIAKIFTGHAHALKPEANLQGGQVWRLVPPKIPNSIAVTVGSILHNLRSPLDQMLSAIALLSHATPDKVGFPFGETEEKFIRRLSEQKKLPTDAKDMLRALQPFESGNALLYALHALNNPDKHHPGLIPIALQTAANLSTLVVSRGTVHTFGPRSGRHFVLDTNGNLAQPDPAKQPGMDVSGSKIVVGTDIGIPKLTIPIFYNQMSNGRAGNLIQIPPYLGSDNLELLTTSLGTKFEVDFEPSFSVAFSNISGLRREPVTATLEQMRQLVEGILRQFESRFFP